MFVSVFHAFEPTSIMRRWHTILPMTQELDLDGVIRQRIRALRLARGWSLDALAARCFLSPSTLSRLETGHRRIALDQLVPIARARGATLDQLVESADDGDVVIRPQRDHEHGRTTWLLTRDDAPHGMTVAKVRITPTEHPPGPQELGVHPGRDWFTVLSGTARLYLGERVILVEAGHAAQFSTMIPHAVTAHGGPVEILVILDHDGERVHLHPATQSPDQQQAPEHQAR
jgi:transcriptional regulator with XRE-family HTH domain